MKPEARSWPELQEEIKKTIASVDSSFDEPLIRYVPSEEKKMLSDGKSPAQSEELKYLNTHWNDWRDGEIPISSHRPLIGPVLVAAKSAVKNYIWNKMFKEYFHREKVYMHNIVRTLNRTADYIDRRDNEMFMQLIDKIDNDVTAVNHRNDLLVELLRSEIQSLKKENQELQEAVSKRCAG